MSRLGIRRRLLLVVVAAVALALAAMVVGFNLLLDRDLSRSADNVVRARAAAELGLLRPVHGRLVVGEAPDDAAADAQVWVFSGTLAVEAPRAGAVLTAAVQRLSTGPARLLDVTSPDTRLYTVPAVFDGRRLGTVVAAVSLGPYHQTRRTALLASLALAGAVLFLVAFAARWLLTSSLRPVARMTRQAAAWSEHDLDRRFGFGEPHDELTELASTLDSLLDRLAASLRREQRFSAELSHELRTPLSRLIGEAELALRRERGTDEYRAAFELVLRNANQLSRTVETLIAAARHESGTARGMSDAYAVAKAAADACSGLAAERSVTVEVPQPEHPIRLGVEADLAERILQPVIENACRYGRSLVRISAERGPEGVVYRVEDDGPGVAESEAGSIFEPGVRGEVGVRDWKTGAGLGLALARRLARSTAGEVVAVATSGGGRFLVRLPAA